ncbi:MAG: PEP/pyruvate-binding domain-containing protein, partial [Flavobacteriaceae bacterium]|nr:PEP/pyruvate-binding domain-containing protein [Flavobacteriaceae bacterium]
MINSTKAETLEFLSKKGFKIPLTFYFNVRKWRRNQESIISKIIKKFEKNSLLAIRSSSKSEDNEQESMAGAFTTLLNIKNEKNDLIQSINKVIDSYDENLFNQVLIQPMVENVKISGVVMTKALDDGSPYYVINFDDSSGKTDTITSGNSINKTVYIYNGFKESDFDSKPLLAVLTKVKKLESLYNSLPLDIEFAVDKNNEVFILQLRLITTSKKWNKKSNELVSERLPFLEIYINYLNKKRLGIFGNKTLLGIMPDWNPAE